MKNTRCKYQYLAQTIEHTQPYRILTFALRTDYSQKFFHTKLATVINFEVQKRTAFESTTEITVQFSLSIAPNLPVTSINYSFKFFLYFMPAQPQFIFLINS